MIRDASIGFVCFAEQDSGLAAREVSVYSGKERGNCYVSRTHLGLKTTGTQASHIESVSLNISESFKEGWAVL
jgi:hypothetical protein